MYLGLGWSPKVTFEGSLRDYRNYSTSASHCLSPSYSSPDHAHPVHEWPEAIVPLSGEENTEIATGECITGTGSTTLPQSGNLHTL